VALGAAIIEKHFTLARADGGPDAAFSLEPAEFAALVRDCRAAWLALGSATYDELGSEGAAAGHRRSLYVAAPVRAGEALTALNIRSVRPGFGLAPKHLSDVLGRRASRDLAFGEPLDWSMVG
jgi:N-acetylneuraminate synthase